MAHTEKCPICLKKRGKRFCVARDAEVCPSCCAGVRGSNCPPTCRHLTVADYRQERDEYEAWNKLRPHLARYMRREAEMEELLSRIERTILETWDSHADVNDRVAGRVLHALAAKLDPSHTHLQNWHYSGSHAEQTLEVALNEEFRLVSPMTPNPQLSRAFQRILLSVIDHYDPKDDRAYLRFVSEFFPKYDDDETDDECDCEKPAYDSEPASAHEVASQSPRMKYFDPQGKEVDASKVRLLEMIISDDPDQVEGMPRLGPDELKSHPELLDQIVEEPDRAHETITELLRRHPDNPVLVHFLVQIAKVRKDDDEVAHLARKNFERHPDYLFAKIDWAQVLLDRKRSDEVPAVFNNQYHLAAIYPGRKYFHTSEAIGFARVMYQYFCAEKGATAAKVYLDMIAQIDPEHGLLKDGQLEKVGFVARLQQQFHRLFATEDDAE